MISGTLTVTQGNHVTNYRWYPYDNNSTASVTKVKISITATGVSIVYDEDDNSTAYYGNYSCGYFEKRVPKLPPKNWRWFHCFTEWIRPTFQSPLIEKVLIDQPPIRIQHRLPILQKNREKRRRFVQALAH